MGRAARSLYRGIHSGFRFRGRNGKRTAARSRYLAPPYMRVKNYLHSRKLMFTIGICGAKTLMVSSEGFSGSTGYIYRPVSYNSRGTLLGLPG